MKLYYDPRPDEPNEITVYVHCRKCLEELPPGTTPRDWARLSVGITAAGEIQIWCTRHNVNVSVIGVHKRIGLDYGDETREIECSRCGSRA